jgi:Protein of unknown function (DUF3455)
MKRESPHPVASQAQGGTMRSRSLSSVAVVSATAMMLAAGCGDGGGSKVTGAGGHGGGGGSSTTGAAGTGAAGTGTAGTGAAGTGAAGTSAGGTGGAGTAGGAGGGSGGGAGAAIDGGTDGGLPFEPVTIPANLAVPAGATLKFKVHARGSQVYTCAASTPAADGGTDAGATTYAWALKAPDAKLYDENNVEVGSHFAGPTWMSKDGSDAVGTRMFASPAPLTDAIDWLLLKASSHMGSGVFADVTYIQRLNTTKGKAPATGCEAGTVGTETSVAYTADYYFYKGGSGDGGVTADWPFTTVTVPAGIAVPSGATLKLRLHAIGAQIYTCTASGGADAGADAGAVMYTWTLKQPDAKLYDDSNVEAGTHGLGPNWTSKDGSVVTGTKLFGVNAPLTDAIQWLLLKAATHTGAGVFADVSYVQRLNTTKGVAPATGCDAGHVAAETSVGYTADYYFYTGDSPADGGTGG